MSSPFHEQLGFPWKAERASASWNAIVGAVVQLTDVARPLREGRALHAEVGVICVAGSVIALAQAQAPTLVSTRTVAAPRFAWNTTVAALVLDTANVT
jgi:hypothetical protein